MYRKKEIRKLNAKKELQREICLKPREALLNR